MHSSGLSSNGSADEIVNHYAGHQPQHHLLLVAEDYYIVPEGTILVAISITGSLLASPACFMKSPPVQHDDDRAHDMVEQFIRETSANRVRRVASRLTELR